MDIIEKARNELLKRVKENGLDPYTLVDHIGEMEKWAEKMLKRYPEADREIVKLSVWLHDIGHYPIDETDHAIKGEKVAREFLEKEGFTGERLEKVLHCVRAHRCKDVMPETLEAKLVACIDSASHMTDSMYVDILKAGKFDYACGKLGRDYRDLASFPEVQAELTPVYESWQKLLFALNRVNKI
jgi:metal-dependent HD superfamily phosphatase/phosphodiesterase